MSEILNSRRASWLAASLIVAAVVVAYANSITVPFLFDDLPSTVENPTIRRLWPVWPILVPPGHFAAVQRRPLVNVSLAINYAISGEQAWSYHLFNVIAHTLAALVLFGVLRRTLLLPRWKDRFARSAAPLAGAVALLWAVHPLLTDAVTYVIQRTEIMAGLFYLLTLYCTIRSASSPRPRRWIIAAVISCFCAMGSKEAALSAPVVVALYDRVFLSASWREVFRRRGALYVGLAFSWLVILAMLPYGAEKTNVFGGLGQVVDYFLAQPGVIAHYLKLSFWPAPLVFDYGFPDTHITWQVILFLALISVLFIAVIDAFRYQPWLGFLGIWFFAILAPSSSFIPLIQQIAGEKRMYLPLAAVVTLVVMGGYLLGEAFVRRGIASRRWTCVGGGALVAVLAVVLVGLTVHRNTDYRSDLSIWQDTVAKRPMSARAHSNLGLALAARGRLDEALAESYKTIELWPTVAPPYNDIGNIMMRRGRVDEAIDYYEKAIFIMPDYDAAHNNLGNTLLAIGRTNEAIEHFKCALKSRPDRETTYNNLGSALATRGQVDEAIRFFQKAVEIRPNFADAHSNLGRALADKGRIDDAVVHFRAAWELKPDKPETRQNLDQALAQQAAQRAAKSK